MLDDWGLLGVHRDLWEKEGSGSEPGRGRRSASSLPSLFFFLAPWAAVHRPERERLLLKRASRPQLTELELEEMMEVEDELASFSRSQEQESQRGGVGGDRVEVCRVDLTKNGRFSGEDVVERICFFRKLKNVPTNLRKRRLVQNP